MNTPKLLTVDEIRKFKEECCQFIPSMPSGALLVNIPAMKSLIETALAAMECKSALELSRAQWIHSVNAKQCVEALKPFQQTGEDRQTEMSILCPICGEPPLCTCQIARMNERLVASESENKRLREALKKIKDIDVNEAYNTPDADYYASWRLCARTAESALEGEE